MSDELKSNDNTDLAPSSVAQTNVRPAGHDRQPVQTTGHMESSTPRGIESDRFAENTSVVEGHSRHWYHLRPEPRSRADFMGYNYTWWMVIGLVIVVFIAIFPW
jgi:hypothetical protein